MYRDPNLLKLALEHIEGNYTVSAEEAIAAIKEALAQTQEPVAWMDADGNVSDNNDHKCFSISLYTHPPQRTWVGLTIEEIASCCRESTTTQLSFYNAIEAKLKDKNT